MSCFVNSQSVFSDGSKYTFLFFSGQVLLPQRGKKEELISASQWELLNLDVGTILQMPSEVQALTSLEHHEFMEIMSKYLYESIGTQEFVRRHMLTQSPCIVVPSTLHISLTKAATILGLGRESLVSVAVDENSRMDPIGWYIFCLSSFSRPIFFFQTINNKKTENGNRTNNCRVYLININKMRINQVLTYIELNYTYLRFVCDHQLIMIFSERYLFS